MTVKISINGPIVSSDEKWIYDYFEEEATCARDVNKALPKNGEDIEITINSWGGYVDQGAEIYTVLKSYEGNVTVNIVSAYSAASVIAMVGDLVRISPVGRMMIHNASGGTFGDYHDMDKGSEMLQNANDSIANAYRLKTGLSREDILSKMDTETWLNAEQAVELGFADEVMFETIEQPRLVANYGSGMLPKNVIEKAKATLEPPIKPKENNENIEDIVNAQVAKVMASFLSSQTGFEGQLPNSIGQNGPDGDSCLENKSTPKNKSLINRLRKGE